MQVLLTAMIPILAEGRAKEIKDWAVDDHSSSLSDVSSPSLLSWPCVVSLSAALSEPGVTRFHRELRDLQPGVDPGFWNAERPLCTCAILASCSDLLIGLFFLRVGAALDVVGAGRAGESSARGACFRTNTRSL